DADARVDRGRVDGTSRCADALVQALDTLVGGEVGAHGLDLRPRRTESLGRLVDAVGLGGDEQIEAVLGELARELVPDAARRSGDDGEGNLGVIGHIASLLSMVALAIRRTMLRRGAAVGVQEAFPERGRRRVGESCVTRLTDS